ncbi:hypothetical protein KCU77_g5515, partial [Aureobasidium melanogenum]
LFLEEPSQLTNTIASSSSYATTAILFAAHHRFASYSAITKMEHPDDQHRLSLPSMPTELLSLLVELVDKKTFQALRLTNKRLCAVSSGHFAVQYFSTRMHVASAYSMDALIQITAHPFFSKFVKTVIISGYLPEPPCECVQSQHHVLSFAKTREKLDKVFAQVKRESSSITIGVSGLYDQYPCYGAGRFVVFEDRLCDHSGRFGPSIALAKVFGLVFDAAQSSGCTIEGVKVDTPSDHFDVVHNISHGLPEFAKLLQTHIIPLRKPLSLDLTIDPAWPEGHLIYNHRTGELKLSHFYLSSSYDSVLSYQNLFPAVKQALPWLMTFSICHVQVSNCAFLGEDMLEILFWSNVLERLSHTTQLRYFEISAPSYLFYVHDIDEDMRSYLELPSGLYELKDTSQLFACRSRFWLNLPGALDKALVLVDLTNVSVELKALADQVAQMEAEKIAEIESDGFVRNNIVGIPEETKTEEDIVSGVDDHGSKEDGTSETDNDGHEHEGDEGGDEHEHIAELSGI